MAAALPFIATAAAVKTAVDADKARKQATRFQGEQNRIAQENAAEMQRRMDEQTAAQQAAAETARQRLEAEQARYAEDKAKMESRSQTACHRPGDPAPRDGRARVWPHPRPCAWWSPRPAVGRPPEPRGRRAG